jgi:hypothetical protein
VHHLVGEALPHAQTLVASRSRYIDIPRFINGLPSFVCRCLIHARLETAGRGATARDDIPRRRLLPLGESCRRI